MSTDSCEIYQNTGAPNCLDIIKVARMVVLVPLYASDGSKNYITPANSILKSGWTSKFDNADPSARFYPTPVVDNVSDTREDSVYETLDSGQKNFIRPGIRTFKGFWIQTKPEYLAKVEKWQTNGDVFGVYFVDKENNVIGNSCSDGNIYPIPVAKGSLSFKYEKSDNKAISKIMIQFDIDQSSGDDLLTVVAYSSMTDITPLQDFYALYTVTGSAASSITTGHFTMSFTNMYGRPVPGLLAANFSVYNNTTSASVTISSVVESPTGTYKINYASGVSSGDSLTLTPTKAGLDFSTVPAIAIAVP